MENFIPINLHETRDFSKKVSVTFEFLRQNFKPLVKSILFIAGPPVLIASLFMGSFFRDLIGASLNAGRTGANPFESFFASPIFFAQIILMVVFFLLATVATIATINNYVILYDEQQTNKVSVTNVWARVRETFWMYLGTTILFYIVGIAAYALMVSLMFGMAMASPFLLFFGVIGVVCGITYLLVSSSLVFIIRAYERIGFFEALSRSFYLVRGKWWSTLGITFVLYLIAGVISYIFMIPGYIMTIISSLHQAEVGDFGEPSANQSTIIVILFTLYYVAQMLLYSLPNLGIAFQYFNLVERKEATGLISQIDSIGQPAAPATNADEHY